ncbi:MAG: hypothetical protein QGG53_16310 [Planctomycetota bacterium]|jgi:adenosylhomocysteine nucleosidase|nr:hypothetical protein [Planctomycetota bacterium]
MIGLLAAFKEEVGGVLSDLRGKTVSKQGEAIFHRGRHLGKHDLVVAISGPGMQRALETSEHLIKEFRPILVLSTGSCGGISADLKTGNLVIPHSVQYLSLHQPDPMPYPAVEMDSELAQSLILARNRCGVLGREGLLLTTDRIVRTADEKRAIMDIPESTAVDMESAAVASAAQDHGVPFGIVRAVSDPAWEGLVVDYEKMLKGKTTATPLDVLGYLATHPWQTGAFVKDVKRVFHASAVLKTYYRSFFDQQTMQMEKG